jgi:hypothetical protein
LRGALHLARYGQFVEGFDAADLHATKLLLDSVDS